MCVTHPMPASSVAGTSTNVKGIYTGPPNSAVIVNGVLAHMSNGTFVANAVPIGGGAVPINATITAQDSTFQTDTVSVNAAGGSPSLVLTASPAANFAPLTVQFSYQLDPSLTARSVSLDFDGDGHDDYTGAPGTLPTNVYSTPGLFTPRLTVIDSQGASHQAEVGIEIVDPIAFEAQLQSMWSAVKDAIRSGNPTGVLQLVVHKVRPDFLAMVSALTPAQQAGIDHILTGISLVKVNRNATTATYEMLRTDNGQQHSYSIVFARDLDGVWRLRKF